MVLKINNKESQLAASFVINTVHQFSNIAMVLSLPYEEGTIIEI